MKDSRTNSVKFTKATACGNDFLIAAWHDDFGDMSQLSQRMCDRHRGVGADGVEWTFDDANSDVRVQLMNADGSEAEISGNGTRCVAAEISSRTGKNEIAVQTAAGIKKCRVIEQHANEMVFESAMGAAELGSQLTIDAADVHAVGTQVSMGNPHYVILVDAFTDGWQKQAATIQAQSHFPQGTNVEYVIGRGPNEIEIRLFERGVGETLSSGTGSCASAVAAIAAGHVSSPVNVIAPGGTQVVRWEREAGQNQVYLRGAASMICRGEFLI